MNGNGKVTTVTRESELDSVLRTMPTKVAIRTIITTLDAQGETLQHLREVSGENTTRLNEHDGYVSILNEKLTEQQAIIDALTTRLDALESDQSELAANQA